MRRTARSYLMPSNLLVSLFGGGAPKFRTFRIAVLPYFRSISSFYFHRSLSIVIAVRAFSASKAVSMLEYRLRNMENREKTFLF